VRCAGRLLEDGYSFDEVYTSVQKRAIRTSWAILHELDSSFLPVHKMWRLNPQCYGALTGLTRSEAIRRYGAEALAAPPPYKDDHHHPRHDRKYGLLQGEQSLFTPPANLPLSETHADVRERCLPVWDDISRQLSAGKAVLVVAHSAPIRALAQAIDGLTDEEAAALEIAPCAPLAYRFERCNGRLVALPAESLSPSSKLPQRGSLPAHSLIALPNSYEASPTKSVAAATPAAETRRPSTGGWRRW